MNEGGVHKNIRGTSNPETQAIAQQNSHERILSRIGEMQTRAEQQRRSKLERDAIDAHGSLLQEFGKQYFSFSESEIKKLSPEELRAFDAVVAKRVRKPLRYFWITEAILALVSVGGAMAIQLEFLIVLVMQFIVGMMVYFGDNELCPHRKFLRTQPLWLEQLEKKAQ